MKLLIAVIFITLASLACGPMFGLMNMVYLFIVTVVYLLIGDTFQEFDYQADMHSLNSIGCDMSFTEYKDSFKDLRDRGVILHRYCYYLYLVAILGMAV